MSGKINRKIKNFNTNKQNTANEIAQQNAESYLTHFFLAFGYSDVIFAVHNP
jgi:hypothetical protein